MTESNRVLPGVVAMLTGIALLGTMDAVVKWLVTNQVSVLHILVLRSWIIVGFMLLSFYGKGAIKELLPVRKAHQFTRGLLAISAPFLFFHGLKYLPLTDSTLVFFTSALTITILSAVILGERVRKHRWLAVIVGYLGVVIAVQPGGDGQMIGYLFAFGGSLGYAYMFISGRYLAKTETVASLVFCFNLGIGITSTLWIFSIDPELIAPISMTAFAGIGLIAALTFVAHFLITVAFAKTQVSIIAPLEYTGVMWAVIFDYFIWQIAPTIAIIIGGLVIISSGLYMMRHECCEQTPESDLRKNSKLQEEILYTG